MVETYKEHKIEDYSGDDVISMMVRGHIQAAEEKDVEITIERAAEIAVYDYLNNEIIHNERGQYLVYVKEKSILGNFFLLTKLYSPPEYRGDGGISKLLDEAPRPLMSVMDLRIVRHKE